MKFSRNRKQLSSVETCINATGFILRPFLNTGFVSVSTPTVFSLIRKSVAFLASASGEALSALGASLGIPRPPEATDEAYRAVLITRCALRRWDGTNEDVQPVLSSVFPDARFSDHGDLSVFAGSATAAALPVPMKTLFPVPAGVKCLTSG